MAIATERTPLITSQEEAGPEAIAETGFESNSVGQAENASSTTLSKWRKILGIILALTGKYFS